MAHLKARRSAVFAAVLGAVMLCMASAAFACSGGWGGEIKVWGGADHLHTVTAIGSYTQSMQFCAGFPTGSVLFSTGRIQTLTVVMGSATDGCNTVVNKLPAGLYSINIIQSDTFGGAWAFNNNTLSLGTGVVPHGDCMNPAAGLSSPNGMVKAGTMSIVDASGNGTGTVTYTAGAYKNAANQAGSICVSNYGGNFTMEAPLVFV